MGRRQRRSQQAGSNGAPGGTLARGSEQAFVFRLLLLYRWAALVVPAVALATSADGDRSLLALALFLVAVADNAIPTLLERRLNALVLRQPALFGLDLAIAVALIGASGGVSSPYYLYALGPTLASAFFFGVRGGILAALVFAPAYVAAAVLGTPARDPSLVPQLLSQLLALAAASVAFGFLSELLARLRATAQDLTRLSDDLRTKNVHLERSNLELQAIQELSAAIREATTVETVQERLLAIVTQRFHFERGIVGLVEPNRPTVSSWLAAGEPARATTLSHTTRAHLEGVESAVAQALALRKAYHVSEGDLAALGEPSLDAALGMRDFVVLPMICRDRPVGVLLVDNPVSGRPVPVEELDGLTRLANQAALAIANVQMCVERAQRTAVRGERQRIAAEMHDAVIQSLYGIALNLDGASRLIGDDPARVRTQLHELRALALDTLGKLRGAVYDLWPDEFSGLALADALRRHAEQTEQLTGMRVDVAISGDVALLDESSSKALYRIAQEALSNASRHSASQQAIVRLQYADGVARLEVVDNGVGFDPRRTNGGLGLRTMRERATAAGGRVEVVARPGEGTTVRATLQCCRVA